MRTPAIALSLSLLAGLPSPAPPAASAEGVDQMATGHPTSFFGFNYFHRLAQTFTVGVDGFLTKIDLGLGAGVAGNASFLPDHPFVLMITGTTSDPVAAGMTCNRVAPPCVFPDLDNVLLSRVITPDDYALLEFVTDHPWGGPRPQFCGLDVPVRAGDQLAVVLENPLDDGPDGVPFTSIFGWGRYPSPRGVDPDYVGGEWWNWRGAGSVSAGFGPYGYTDVTGNNQDYLFRTYVSDVPRAAECPQLTPARSSSWGSVKVRYR